MGTMAKVRDALRAVPNELNPNRLLGGGVNRSYSSPVREFAGMDENWSPPIPA
jgi:hypothetical protein